MAHSTTETIWETSKQETQEMMAIWPDIVRDITEMIKNLNIPDVAKWMETVLQHNVPHGKKLRSIALIYAYKMLIPKDQLTEDTMRLVRILAWCVEMMQAFLLLLDDIQDRSLLRRGQPCWYRQNNIGVAAINDGILLEHAMYYIIQKYFKGKDCYIGLVEIFHDVVLKTSIGQCLDLITTNFGKNPNLDLFTTDLYNSIAEYKTAYYAYFVAITVAMHFAGIKDPEMFRQAIPVSLKIGQLLQVQDDYLDCFGDPNVCGKDGTDIQDGKCTWFITRALQHTTPQQRKILEECYGVADPEKVKRVKQLFTDLNLLDAYLTYENEQYNQLNVSIQQMSCGLSHNMFSNLINRIYRRSL